MERWADEINIWRWENEKAQARKGDSSWADCIVCFNIALFFFYTEKRVNMKALISSRETNVRFPEKKENKCETPLNKKVNQSVAQVSKKFWG